MGVTGLIVIGESYLKAIDKNSKPFSDSISHILIRFHPQNLNQFVEMKKFEISHQTNNNALYDFFIEAFRKLYHSNQDAILPPPDVFAAYFKTFSGKNGWLNIDAKSSNITINSYIDNVFKLLKSGKKELALKESEQLYVKYPSDAEVVSTYGRMEVENMHYSNAIPLLKKAIEMNPDQKWITAWAYAYLGKAYYMVNEKAKAKEALNNCIQINATTNATSFAKNLLASYDL